jgi:hypothetical protein
VDVSTRFRRVDRTNHIIPCGNDRFHVKIAGKKCNDPVWNNLAILDQDTAKIANNRRVVSDFKAGADSDLITATSDNLDRFRQLWSGMCELGK